MTEAEQYKVILGALAEKIKEKDETIVFQKYQIDALKKKLAEAEFHLDPTPEREKNLEIR